MKKIRKVALLRGINVAGKNKLKMVDLKASLEAAGLSEVRTYLQSGNIGFCSNKSLAAMELLIKKTIRQDFGFDVPTLVRPQAFFIKLIANSPFFENEVPLHDEKELHVTLLADQPTKKSVAALRECSADDHEIIDKIIYLRCANGYSKTKLTNGFIERKLGTRATTRNWKTIRALTEL